MSSSEPESPRRGPRRLDPDALDAFVAAERWGSLAFEAPGGELSALPVRMRGVGGGQLHIAFPASRRPAELGGATARVAVVADEFESYEGIRGVIIRGALRQHLVDRRHPEDAMGVVEVASAVGFSFAGTLPPPLRGG